MHFALNNPYCRTFCCICFSSSVSGVLKVSKFILRTLTSSQPSNCTLMPGTSKLYFTAKRAMSTPWL